MKSRIISRFQTEQAAKAGLVLLGCSLAALGIAWWVEHIWLIVPCEMCLLERWPWRFAALTGLLAIVLKGRLAEIMIPAGCLALLLVVGMSVLHAGVEAGYWPSPFPGCQAPDLSGTSVADFLKHLPARPAKPCDAPTYLIRGLPVSMTVMGGLAAFMTAGAALLVFFRRQTPVSKPGL